MFFGGQCVACRRPGERLCAACGDQLQLARPFGPPAGLDACVALLAYDGVARDLVVALKYRNTRSLAHRCGTALAALVRTQLVVEGAGTARRATGAAGIDLVTWAPTGARRRRVRGYDQAELLARVLGRRLHLPTRALLVRGPGVAQTGRSRAARLAGPAFGLTAGAARDHGAAILVVDDVLTTGATLTAAARALHELDPTWVGGAVLAHTELTP